VPEKAIQFEAGGPQVVVVRDDDRVQRVAVTTGARADGWVELRQGPVPGTRVALGGGAFVLDGDKVRIAPPAADTAPQAVSAPGTAPAAPETPGTPGTAR